MAWKMHYPQSGQRIEAFTRKGCPMGLLLIIILLLVLFGGLPTWGYSRNWGYGPSGIVGLLVLVLLLLLVFQVIPWGFPGPVTHY
jgi:hypothetical protein